LSFHLGFSSARFFASLGRERAKHDFVAIHIHDEREKVLPNIGIITLEMLRPATKSRSTRPIAQHGRVSPVSSMNTKQNFHARFGGTILTESRCKPEDYLPPLRSFFKQRGAPSSYSVMNNIDNYISKFPIASLPCRKFTILHRRLITL